MNKQRKKSKQSHHACARRRIVVFDIDSTLCKKWENKKKKIIEDNHPECPIIAWKRLRYVFLPHLQILFDYLLKHDARVAFFSAATNERNDVLIPKLLKSLWGAEKYETLRAEGQFDIHSQEDLHQTSRIVKDLKTVIRDGESLSDVILVDDDPGYVAHGQRPCLQSIDLFHWDYSNDDEYFYKNPKNGVYYMLGLLKTLFEDEKYKELDLKKAISQIVPKKYNPTVKYDSFKRRMIDMGLLEVQKEVPDAELFGSSTLVKGRKKMKRSWDDAF